MAEQNEKYFWLLWTIATTLYAYFYFSLQVTTAFFMAGLIISSKCLAEDFFNRQENDEKQNEENH